MEIIISSGDPACAGHHAGRPCAQRQRHGNDRRKTAYLQNHIEKLLASDEIRQCRPLPDSAFRNELEHNGDFVDLSCRIAGVLFDYMHAHTTIPGQTLRWWISPATANPGWAS